MSGSVGEGNVFVNGKGVEFVFGTTEGPVYLATRVRIVGKDIFFDQLTIYSATGFPLKAGTGQMLAIVRELEGAARDEGFATYTFAAVRQRPGKPERMISITRKLR